MATYLVTGACGFIGCNFVYYLLEREPGAKVVAVDNLSPNSNKANLDPIVDRVPLEVADICDESRMTEIYTKYSPDYIVNFAAESHNDRAILSPSSFARSNALGAQVLLEVSRKIPVQRHAHISTIEIYGEMGPDVPFFTEGSPVNAKTPYSAAKAAGDFFVRAYMQTYPEMDIVMSHCANNYGPYQFPEKLIPLVIANMLTGKRAAIYGDGKQRRDWLHVKDHCSAIYAMLQGPRTEIPPEAAFDAAHLPIFDVSARNELTNIDIVSRIARLLGKEPDDVIEYVADRPNHDRRYLINPDKLETQLDWKPEVEFEQGLEETVRWYVDNQDWWKAILERNKGLQIDWSKR